MSKGNEVSRQFSPVEAALMIRKLISRIKDTVPIFKKVKINNLPEQLSRDFASTVEAIGIIIENTDTNQLRGYIGQLLKKRFLESPWGKRLLIYTAANFLRNSPREELFPLEQEFAEVVEKELGALTSIKKIIQEESLLGQLLLGYLYSCGPSDGEEWSIGKQEMLFAVTFRRIGTEEEREKLYYKLPSLLKRLQYPAGLIAGNLREETLKGNIGNLLALERGEIPELLNYFIPLVINDVIKTGKQTKMAEGEISERVRQVIGQLTNPYPEPSEPPPLPSYMVYSEPTEPPPLDEAGRLPPPNICPSCGEALEPGEHHPLCFCSKCHGKCHPGKKYCPESGLPLVS
jgi:hypothetical protein